MSRCPECHTDAAYPCKPDCSRAARMRGEPNRFRAVLPEAIPWRERRDSDPMAHALVRVGATDAEAADVFAAECARLRKEAAWLALFQPPAPIVIKREG